MENKPVHRFTFYVFGLSYLLLSIITDEVRFLYFAAPLIAMPWFDEGFEQLMNAIKDYKKSKEELENETE